MTGFMLTYGSTIGQLLQSYTNKTRFVNNQK